MFPTPENFVWLETRHSTELTLASEVLLSTIESREGQSVPHRVAALSVCLSCFLSQFVQEPFSRESRPCVLDSNSLNILFSWPDARPYRCSPPNKQHMQSIHDCDSLIP